MKTIEIYTDGACRGNPGPGGYACVLRYLNEKGDLYTKELSAGYGLTTNNRMELLAAIIGLEALKEQCEVRLYSDSRYLINAYENGWVEKWKAFGWHRDVKRKEPVKNKDLWQRLDALIARHEVSFIWVKGHDDNELNNRCDQLAVEAALNTESHIAQSFMEE